MKHLAKRDGNELDHVLWGPSSPALAWHSKAHLGLGNGSWRLEAPEGNWGAPLYTDLGTKMPAARTAMHSFIFAFKDEKAKAECLQEGGYLT